MGNIYTFPKVFIDAWNDLAAEGVISPSGVEELKSIASETPEEDDNQFLGNMEAVTTDRFENSLTSSFALCVVAVDGMKAGLFMEKTRVIFADNSKEVREVTLGGDENGCTTQIKVHRPRTLSCLCNTPGSVGGSVLDSSILSLLMMLIFD